MEALAGITLARAFGSEGRIEPTTFGLHEVLALQAKSSWTKSCDGDADEEEPAIDLRSQIEKVLAKAPFIADLGVTLVGVGPGWLETELAVVPRLRQQHGYIHAGVVATLADHTAGGAASTSVVSGQSVLTADFTIQLLRPASGDLLRCRGEVVKSGKRLIVAQADVWDGDSHCARYLGTMAVVDQAL